MIMKNSKKNRYVLMASAFLLLLVSSCVEVPELGSIAPDVRYKNRKQYAISGMEQHIGEFLGSTSTLPLNFEIINIRETNNKSTAALREQLPLVQYKEPIVGGETEEELALKRYTVLRDAASINPFTGKIEILEGNNIPAGEYHLDIKVTNTSGSVILEDAIVLEFKEYEVISSSPGMLKAPEIVRVADAPNQILFVGHLNGVPLHGNRIDFTRERAAGFKGTFEDDRADGEVWKVKFPVKPSNTYCNWQLIGPTGETSYLSENFNFVLGRPGSYVIKLYR